MKMFLMVDVVCEDGVSVTDFARAVMAAKEAFKQFGVNIRVRRASVSDRPLAAVEAKAAE